MFIDLKKAFDTVDHNILCKKLDLYGVHHRELSWFKSYLTNRKQFCRVNGVDSEIEDIEVGVPQVSCLGPLLFLVYINDLPQAVLDSNVSMYADDTSLCYQSHDMIRLNEAINSDLAKLDTWLQGNKLSLNVAKTHSMLISSKQKHNSILKGQNEDLKLKIRDNELEVVKKAKYLGLQIDCSLDWKKTDQGSFCQGLQGNRISKTCQVFSSETNFANSLYKYCGASFSILLFCLGLRGFKLN